jgi:hypothetical protein
MHFKIKGAIWDIETIATGHGVKNPAAETAGFFTLLK